MVIPVLKKMKILLLNGSPNAKGCTYTALSEVAKTITKAASKPILSTWATLRSNSYNSYNSPLQ